MTENSAAGAVPARRGAPEIWSVQFATLSRQIPLMYTVLTVNTWTLGYTFRNLAPRGLVVGPAAALTVVSVVRLATWWRKRSVVPDPALARRELTRTNVMAGVLGVLLPLWTIVLFPYGDAVAQGHLVLYLAISLLICLLCLIYASRAATIIAVASSATLLTYFVLWGGAVFLMMMANTILVAVVALTIVRAQNRDFVSRVRAQAEARERRQEETRLLRMIDEMPMAVMTAEPEGNRITYINDACRDLLRQVEPMLPVAVDQVVGMSMDVFHRRPAAQRRVVSGLGALPHVGRIEIGAELLDIQVSAITGEDRTVLGSMVTWKIVTKEVQAQERIRELAHNDALTGLPNRSTFREHLDVALAEPAGRIGVLFIDLDGFKTVNDMYGHRVGDVLLGQVAERLRTVCADQGAVVGRLGGDEFTVLLHEDNCNRAEALAGEIVEGLAEPYRLGRDRKVRIDACVGIAFAPENGTDADTLLSRADIALYAAKAVGPGTLRTFSADMERRITERVEMEDALRAALESRDRLFVFYQPIVDLATGRVTSREALVRWHHAGRGWVPPSEFVPVAEGSGLIDELGEFVLDQACRAALEWEDGARVAVNVSAEQLGRGTLLPTVLAALAASGLPADRLEVEVTETALIGREEASIGDLHRLREAGVRVALDDFGTGYSSLSHLRAFPFDKIKIDGSFVRDAVARPDCAAVVRGVAELGRALGAATVAEGVETQAQLDRVRAEGCTEIQGYLYGRPEPSERDAARVAALSGAVPSATTLLA